MTDIDADQQNLECIRIDDEQDIFFFLKKNKQINVVTRG